MPASPTTKWSLVARASSDAISTIAAGEQAFLGLIDGYLSPWSSGTLASRPAAGKAGRRYLATDVGSFGCEYVDNGAAWIIPSGMVKLAEVVRGSTGQIDFTSIPQGFSHLRLVGSLRSARAGVASAGTRLLLNGNTAALYEHNWTAGSGSALTFAYVGTVPAGLANAAAFGAFLLDIPAYAQSGKWRTLIGSTACTGASGLAGDAGSSQWQSTAAISSISVNDDVSGFASGSMLTLYGLA